MIFNEIVKLIFLALGALICALFMSLFVTVPEYGHPVDFENWPEEAKRIALEHRHEPISEEQWRRIDKVLVNSGERDGVSILFLADVRNSWYWFLIFPIVSLGVVYKRAKGSMFIYLSVLFGPCILLLVLATLKS